MKFTLIVCSGATAVCICRNTSESAWSTDHPQGAAARLADDSRGDE